MNRKALAVVLALIVLGAGAVILLTPRSSNTFHLEATHPEGDRGSARLLLDNLEDCALNVSFTDNPDLLYSFDVELYEPASSGAAYSLIVNDYRVQSDRIDIAFDGLLRIKNLHIVLGTGVPYNIVVQSSCDNVNSTFTYGNNMIGSDARLQYTATGSFVYLAFTEDIVFQDTGMLVTVSTGSAYRPDYVYATVDLPEGCNGIASFLKPVSIHAISGWSWYSELASSVRYSTQFHDQQPLLEMGLWAEYGVHVWLSD